MATNNFKLSTRSKLLLAVFSVAVTAAVAFLQFRQTSFVNAQNPPEAAAPTLQAQYGDDQDSSPNLPQDCGQHIGVSGNHAYDSNNPDCLQVRVTDPANTVYTQDFRFCLKYYDNGWNFRSESCTRYASEIGLSADYAPGPTRSNNGGTLGGHMVAIMETRAMPATVPSGTTFGNVYLGALLAYQEDNGPCEGSGGMQWTPSVGSWNPWAYSHRDNDPGCFQAAMRIGSLNMPPGAEYASTTIPSSLTASTVHNGNYKIDMRNLGMPWPVTDAASVVHDGDNCPTEPESYAPGQTCTGYYILSSQRFRLERMDDTPIGVRSRRLGTGSSEVTYTNGTYNYSGPDTNIARRSGATIDAASTVPFFTRQEITYRAVTRRVLVCEEGGGGGVYKPNKFFSFLFIKRAQALPPAGCFWENYRELVTESSPADPNINFNQIAGFAPLNITTPATAGTYNLRFKMVDLENLGTTNQYLEQGRFGSEAVIPINVYAPFSLSCDATHTVTQGTAAQYAVSATPSGGFNGNVNVTVASQQNPGPVASPASITLTSPGYTGTMNLQTAGLSAGTYNLTFTGTAPEGSATCPSLLEVTALPQTPDVDIKFNNSDNPDPLNAGESGVIKWTTENVTSCTASSNPSTTWSGGRSANAPAPAGLTEPVGPLVSNTYTFSISCTGPGGTDADQVEVYVGNPPPTTVLADLKCQGPNNPQPIDGTCVIPYNTAATLYWTSEEATTCSIGNGFNPALPATPVGAGNMSTGNLTTDKTFVLTCSNPTDSETDSVIIDVQPPPPPTVDLKCRGTYDTQPQIGPCVVDYGTPGTLSWSNQNVDECFLDNGIGEVDNPVSGSLPTGNLTAGRTYTMSCNGTGGSGSDPVSFTISPGSFTLTCSPVMLTFIKGQTPPQFFNLSTTPVGGFNDPVHFTVSGLPSGVSVNFGATNDRVPAATTVATVTVSGLAPTGDHDINFYGEGGGSSADCDRTIRIQDPGAPSASITCNGLDNSCSINQGASATIAWTSQNVGSCEITSNPPGYFWSGTSGSQNVTLAQSTRFDILCDEGLVSQASDSVQVNVALQESFTLTCSPVMLTFVKGQTPPQFFNLSTTPNNGFNDPVHFTVSGLPVGVSVNFGATNDRVPAATTVATVTVGASAPTGDHDINFYGEGGGSSADCDRTIRIQDPGAPSASITCNGEDTSCTLPAGGGRVRIGWTSQNIDDCTVTSSPPGYSWTGQTGTRNITVTQTTRFDQVCTGPNGPASDSVTVNVGMPPPGESFTLTCSPVMLTFVKGQTPPQFFSLSTTPVGGFDDPVHFTVTGVPSGVTVDFGSTNDRIPPATTVATVTVGGTATAGDYDINFNGTSGPHNADCDRTIRISDPPGGNPEPPSQVQVLTNGVCNSLTVSWRRPTSGPTPTSYKVFWTNQANKSQPDENTWVYITTINDAGDIVYSHTDNPARSPGVNYYGISAVANGLESAKAWSSNVPSSCASNLSVSDKDVYRVNGLVNAGISDCSGATTDIIEKKFGLIRAGDVITYKINICNSGDTDATITRVVDNFTNLIKSNTGWGAEYVAGGVTYPIAASEIEELTNSKGQIIGVAFNFSPSKVVPKKVGSQYGVGSVIFKAQVNALQTLSSGIYRFQNRAVIYEQNGNTTSVSTPLFLFTTGAGSPDLKEVAP